MKIKCCGVHHEKMHSSKWNIIYVYIVITLLLIDVLACMIGYYGLMVVTSIPNKKRNYDSLLSSDRRVLRSPLPILQR